MTTGLHTNKALGIPETREIHIGQQLCCLECKRASLRRHYALHRERRLREKREYAKRFPETLRARKRDYYMRNRARIIKKVTEYYNRTRPERIIARKRRIATDPLARLAVRMRSRLAAFIRTKGFRKPNRMAVLLGADWKMLMAWLESQFKPGMSWRNYGKWHIDHIIPLSAAKSEDDLYVLCHYKNLQPLWARDNRSKGAKIPISEFV